MTTARMEGNAVLKRFKLWVLVLVCSGLVLSAYGVAASDDVEDVEGFSAERVLRQTRGGENVKWPSDPDFKRTLDQSTDRKDYNRALTGRDRLEPLPVKVYERIPTRRNVVYLTFDDGPYTDESPALVASTEDLLRVMQEKGATGTFFFQGIWSFKNKKTVQAVIAAGSNIGNHTCHHPPDGSFLTASGIARPPLRKKLEGLPPAWQAREVLWGRAGLLFANDWKRRGITRYFRAPHGSGVVNYPRHPASPSCMKTIAANGHVIINGDLRLSDARGDLSEQTLVKTYDDYFRRGRPGRLRGTILWLHSGLKPTVQALPAILDMLAKLGYQVERLPDGLERGPGMQADSGLWAEVENPLFPWNI